MRKQNIAAIAASAALAAAAFASAAPMMPGAAEKINSVSVTFEAEDFDDTDGLPVVGATTKKDTYSVGEVTNAYEYYNDEQYEGKNVYVVELSAEDGYYFNITKASNISLKGAGAEYVKASRRDNGTTLIITAKLTKMDSFLGTVDDPTWEGQRGVWNEAYGASFYKLTLIGPDGKLKRVETGGTSYDFAPFMQEAGSYSYRVRPVSINNKFGENAEANTISVSEEEAANNKSKYGVERQVRFIGEEKTPSNAIYEYIGAGWQQNADGTYWFKNTDGSYPQMNWLNDNGAWYFFDENGTMVTNMVISWQGNDYYFGADGKLVTNAKTPDGRTADENGVLSAK